MLWCVWYVKGRGHGSSIHPPTHQGDRTWSLSGSWQKSMLHCIYTPQGSTAAINRHRVLYVLQLVLSTSFSPYRPLWFTMLCREIRVFVFITTLMILFILFCHLNFTNTHGQLNSRMKEFADYAKGRNLKSYWRTERAWKRMLKFATALRHSLGVWSIMWIVSCSLSGTPGVDVV